jgi:GNAT superfamily N-acetyltransferase
MVKTVEELQEFVDRRWSLIREEKWISLDVEVLEAQNSIWISRIFTPRGIRSRGYGREALERLCEAADEDDVRLVLGVNPYGELTHEQLVCFYESVGFEWDGELMVREPNP